MKSYLPAVAIGTALTVAAIGFGAATAHASFDFTNDTASSAASQLQSMGYSVQFNGTSNGNLSMCSVTGVEGLSAKAFGTVYVDLDCPDSNN